MEEEPRFSAVRQGTGQEQEPEAVGRGEARVLPGALEDEELVAEESSLCDPARFTKRKAVKL